MTIDELRTTLLGMKAGERSGISREEYRDLFPPGTREQEARASCREFASSVGCSVEDISEKHSIWFVKSKIAD